MQTNTKNPQDTALNESQIELLALLKSPQKKSPDWQDKAARLMAMEHSKSLANDIDDVHYFRSLALCKLAQIAGVNEAKKKNLQATRFRSTPAPILRTVGSNDLLNASIDLLSPLRGDWVSAYISQEVINPNIDKKGLTSLLKWAEKTASTPAELLAILLADALSENADEKKILVLIKDAASKIKFPGSSTAEVAAGNLLSAVSAISQMLQASQSKKITLGLLSLLRVCIDRSRQAHPTVVIQGPFIASIRTMQEKINQPASKKIAQTLASQQVPAVLSALNDLISLGGDEGARYGRLIYPSLRDALPNFDKALDDMSKTNQGLKLLKESGEGEHSLEDSATSIYARLLPAWHDFVSTFDQASQLNVMNADLLEAAAFNGVELLGKRGEKIAFDPIAHRLHTAQSNQPEMVEIVRPAVIFRRSNSVRIVLPAIVLPV
jgi:hypothetical protein